MEEAEKFLTTLSAEEQEKYSRLRVKQDDLGKQIENATSQITEFDYRLRKLEEELRLIPVSSSFWIFI